MKHSTVKVFSLIILLILCLCLFAPASDAKAASDPLSDLFTMVIMTDSDITLDIGGSHTLFAFSTDGSKVTFKSSNGKVASVSSYGVIEAKKKGTATITAKCKKAKATCRVTVLETTITLSKKNVTLDCGKMTGITAVTSNGSAVSYRSDKPSIAKVSEKGLITALKPGTCRIIVSADSSKAYVGVTVAKPTVTLNAENVTLWRGDSFRLTAAVSSGRPVTYKTRKKSVATVSGDGTITAQKHGTAVITATVDGVSAECLVSVESPVITLEKDEITIKKGSSASLSAKVSSGNSPEWSSSNTAIVRIEKKTGRFTAVSKGKAFIYASEDGAKARCRVTVTD